MASSDQETRLNLPVEPARQSQEILENREEKIQDFVELLREANLRYCAAVLKKRPLDMQSDLSDSAESIADMLSQLRDTR